MLKRKREDSRSWSNLPSELLELIAERINSSHILILRFRAVCKSWRACCPLLPRNNLFRHQLHNPILYPTYFNKSQLTKSTLYLIVEPLSRTSKSKRILHRPWLVMLDDLSPGKFLIRHPLTKTQLSHYSINSFPKALNVLDFHVFEIAHSFTMSGLMYETDRAVFHPCFWNLHMDKVLTVPGSDQYLLVLDTFGNFDILKHSDDSWIVHRSIRQRYRLDDVVQHKEKIVGVDRIGKVYRVEHNKGTFTMNAISRGIRAGAGRRKRLVVTKDDGCLYLLSQCNEVDGIVHFKVYKLDEIQGRWLSIESLNDHVFVVGADFSISFPAQRYPQFQFQGNNIFASDYGFDGRGDNELSNCCARDKNLHRIGMFSVKYGGRYGNIDSCGVLLPPPSLLESII